MTQASFDPPVGIPQDLAPALRRILAPNPSPMTFRGTNTYLLGTREIAVIDPGPDSADHLNAILGALRGGQTITHIVVTHAHLDHSPLARALSAHTKAPVLAFGDAAAGRSDAMKAVIAAGLTSGGEGVDSAFTPDIHLPHGAEFQAGDQTLTALHTPGHMGNHMCFDWNGAVFCGDLVMGWASSLVSPPDGDLTDFMASCHMLAARAPRILHAGHGAPIERPGERLEWLIAHRRHREAQILDALAHGPARATDLARQIYTETPPALLPAATRNVFAHLVDLMGRAAIEFDGAPTETALAKRL